MQVLILSSIVINPVDYVFRGIGVNCEIMDHTSTESQYILQFIENSLEGRKYQGGMRIFQIDIFLFNGCSMLSHVFLK